MDLALTSTTRYVEDQTWLRNPLSARTQSATLDVSAHTQANHFANGYMPSGMTLGIITATGLAAFYDATPAVDGTETAVGLLFRSVVIDTVNLNDVGISIMTAGDIISTNLPDMGTTVDGLWDAAAQADLPAIVDAF